MTYDSENKTVALTVGELAEAIRAALGDLKVYVLESDITAAQTAVKTVVEQAKF